MLTQILSKSSYQDGRINYLMVDGTEVTQDKYDTEMKRACLFQHEKIIRPEMSDGFLHVPKVAHIIQYFPLPFYRN